MHAIPEVVDAVNRFDVTEQGVMDVSDAINVVEGAEVVDVAEGEHKDVVDTVEAAVGNGKDVVEGVDGPFPDTLVTPTKVIEVVEVVEDVDNNPCSSKDANAGRAVATARPGAGAGYGAWYGLA